MRTTTKPRANWKLIGAELRRFPGEWRALPQGHPQPNPSRLRDGLYKHLPAGWFEAKVSRHGGTIMRYVGRPLTEDPLPEAATHEDHVRRSAAYAELYRDIAAAPRRIPELGGIVTFALVLVPESIDLDPVEPDGDDLPRIKEGGRESWPIVAEKVRAAPGVWHRVLGRWGVQAGPIRKGTLSAFRPAGAYEARVRDYELEIRYVGTGDEAVS